MAIKINGLEAGGSLLLSQQTVSGGPLGSVTFNNLDGIAHGGYRLEIFAPSGGSGYNYHFGLLINGLSTLSNYKGSCFINVNGTPSYSNIAQVNQIGGVFGNDSQSQGISTMYSDIAIVNSKVTVHAQSFAIIGTSVMNPHFVLNFFQYTPDVANITSLVIQCYTRDTVNTANGIPNGTILRLFRKI